MEKNEKKALPPGQCEPCQQLSRDELVRRYELILESAAEGIFGLDTQGNYTFMNRAAEVMLGYERGELIGKHSHSCVHYCRPDGTYLPEEECWTYQAFRDGTTRHVDDEIFCRKNGTKFPVEYTSTPIRDDGKIIGAVVTFSDISERKIAAEQLGESQKKFKDLTERSVVGVYVIQNDLFVYVNPRFAEIFGYSVAELLNENYHRVIMQDDVPRVEACVRKRVEGEEESGHYTFRGRMKNGTIIDVEVFSTATLYQGNTAIIGTLLDITERKRSELETQRVMALLKEAQHIAGIGNWEWTVPEDKLTGSDEMYHILGIPPDQFKGNYQAFWEMLHPEDRPVIEERIAESIRVRKDSSQHEYRIIRPDGKISILNLRARFEYNGAGVLIRIHGTVQDVTETRQAEKNLRLIQFAVDSASVSAFLIGPDARILYVNEEACRTHGYSREEMLGMTVPDLHPPDVPLTQWNKDWEWLKLHKRLHGESVHLRKDGSRIDVDISANYISFGGHEYDWAFTVDITERKKAEEKLQESEERFRQLAEHTDQVFWFVNPSQDRILYVSPAYERIWGHRPEQLYADPRLWMKPIHPEDRPRVDRLNRDWRSGKAPVYDVEYRIVRPNGEIRWIRDRGTLVRDANGSIVRLSGIADDITDRKKTEREMQQTRSQLEEAQHIAGIGNWEWDAQTDRVTWSEEVYRIFGLSRQQFKGTLAAVLEMVHPDDRPRVYGKLAESHRKLTETSFNEYRIVRPDGNIRLLYTRSRFLYNAEGSLVGLRGTAQDVTDIRQAEEALKLTQFSLDHASVSAFFIDRNGRILYANEHASRTHGYSREEFLSMTIPDIDPYYPRERWDDHWELLKKKQSLHFESVHRRKDGTLMPVDVSVNYLYFAGREYNIGFSLDITERKQAEDSLRQYANLTETIIDSMNDAISLIDVRDFTIVRVNKVFLEKYGYTDQAQVAGKHCYELTHHRTDVCSPPDDICPLVETVKTRDHFAVDHVHYDVRGRKIYVEVSTSPIRDEAGNVIQVVHVQRDITERKRAEEALRLSESRFRNLFKQSTLSMQIFSPGGQCIEVNDAWEELWHLSRDTVSRYNILEDEQLKAKVVMSYIHKGFAGEATEIPTFLYDPSGFGDSGRARWVKAFIYPVKAYDDGIHEVVLMHVDMTDTIEAGEALRESEQRFRAFFELAAVGAVEMDPDRKHFLQVNDRFCEITGYSREELAVKGAADLTLLDDREADEESYERARKGLARGHSIEKRYLHKDGHIVWVHVWGSIIRDAQGRHVRTAGIVQDVTDRKKMEEDIRDMAHHDALTGLPNRRLFNDLLSLEIAQAKRSGKKAAVLFLDLDRFKEINDTFGHEAGDRLLTDVAVRLKSQLRQSDSIGRIGGDEFNLILADISRPEDVSEIARKLVDSFKTPFVISGQQLYVTTSVGISIYPDDSRDIEALLRYSDMAMYHAKETGRNTYQFYDPSINIRSIERLRMENMLRRSLEMGEMVVYYQPMVDIETGAIKCAEALLRWRHTEKGLLLPNHFIPMAEETGFITEIDDFVLRTVCRQIRVWQDAHFPPLCVTVNLSARQFQSPELLRKIQSLLAETGAAPDSLDIEIPESMAMSDVDRSAALMRKLVGIGVHISIDDFGTGYSSLNYLKRMPIEKLKIDRSFIMDITVDRDDRAIIRAVTAMAHSMRMKVIAEGVESDDQLAFLRETECDEAQGFLFSEPVTAREFEELITAGK